MISAFDVYLVLQLDTFRGAATSLAMVAVLFGGPMFVVGVMASTDGEGWAPPLIKRAQVLLGVALVAFGIRTFIPSTQTMAAMIVLPALTSDEVVQPVKKEAAELYGLAKQALRQAVEGDPKKAGGDE